MPKNRKVLAAPAGALTFGVVAALGLSSLVNSAAADGLGQLECGGELSETTSIDYAPEFDGAQSVEAAVSGWATDRAFFGVKRDSLSAAHRGPGTKTEESVSERDREYVEAAARHLAVIETREGAHEDVPYWELAIEHAGTNTRVAQALVERSATQRGFVVTQVSECVQLSDGKHLRGRLVDDRGEPRTSERRDSGEATS